MSLLIARNTVSHSGLHLAARAAHPSARLGVVSARAFSSVSNTSPTALEVPQRARTADADGTAAALAAGRAHAQRLAGLHIPTTECRASSLGSEARQLNLAASAVANMHTSATAANEAPSTSSSGGVTKGRLTEGAHYNDKLPDAAAPLSDLDMTGGWTLMNPVYTPGELDTVEVVGRPPVTLADKAAHGSVKLLRRMFDLVSGYIAQPIPAEVLKQKPIPIAELRKSGKLLSDKAWLLRIILLESVAGVPGMVGGTLRHLRSLRLLRRDGGWIHTLLEEAENERMHLLTFLTVAKPNLFTRALVLAAQGVFYNAFFLTYLVSPATAHRFVGALEEEAVRTYTHCIEDVTRGLVPEWDDKKAPQIAIDYWRMPQDATLLDVIKAVRADEATHRFVNHSLANLDQKHDFNPFALAEASPELRGTRAGFTREESAEFARQTQSRMLGHTLKPEEPVEAPKKK